MAGVRSSLFSKGHVLLFKRELATLFLNSYLIRPSSLSPQASPLIDERRKLQKREEPTGAEKGKETANNNEIEVNILHYMIKGSKV